VPSLYVGDNLVGLVDSADRPWFFIGVWEEPPDCGLKFDDGAEHAALEPFLAGTRLRIELDPVPL
jgi:hypothetical protein